MADSSDQQMSTAASGLWVRVLLGAVVAVVPGVLLVWWWLGSAVPEQPAAAPRAAQAGDAGRPWPGATLPPSAAETPAAAAAVTAAAALAAAASAAPLRVTVSYAGNAAALPDAARVYVFVRRRGERMPLAVERYTASDLPVTVVFPGQGPTVPLELVARLSMSGNVTFDPGDLETVASPADADASGGVPLVLQSE